MAQRKSDKFLKLIGKHQERAKEPKFHGTLADYLKIIEKNSDIVKLSHKRLYDAIMDHGLTRMQKSDDRCNKLFGSEELRTYHYFQDKFF